MAARTRVCGLVCGLLLGCTSPPPDESAPEPAPVVERIPNPTLHSVDGLASHPSGRPGPAYFFGGHRLVALGEHGWTVVDEPPENERFELFMGADGRAYARSSHELLWLEDDRVGTLASSDSDTLIVDAAVGPAGEIALLRARPRSCCGRGGWLQFYRDGLWFSSPSERDLRPLGQYAGFDGQGRLWVWLRSVTRSEWSWPTLTEQRVTVELPMPRQWGHFAVSPRGEIYMFGNGAAYRLDDGSYTRIPLPGLEEPSHASISQSGTLALSWADSCEVVRVEVDDPPRIEAIDADIDCEFEDYTQAIDGRGRIWIPTSTTLWVFPPKQAPVKYGFGTLPLLPSGAWQIAVVGAGPELPPPGPVRTATLAGRIAIEANADAGSAANRGLVLWSGTRSLKAAEWVFRTTTNEHGEFEFIDVPIGVYQLATEDGRASWFIDREAAQMREGERLDLGTLKYGSLAGLGLIGTSK